MGHTAQHIGLVAIRRRGKLFPLLVNFQFIRLLLPSPNFRLVQFCVHVSIWLLDFGHLFFLPAVRMSFSLCWNTKIVCTSHSIQCYICARCNYLIVVYCMPTKFSWSHTYNSIEPQFMDLFPNTHRCARGGACTAKCTNGPMPMICAQGTKSSIKFRLCTNIQYGMCCIHTCTCVRNASTLELTRFASKQTLILKEDSSRYAKKKLFGEIYCAFDE